MAELVTGALDHHSGEDNIVNVVAIDSGSGSIKFGVAHVNTTTHEVDDIQYTHLAIQLAKDLENHTLLQEIKESGFIQNLYDAKNIPLNMCGFFNPDLDQGSEILNLFKPMSSKEANESLEGSYSNKFSETVKELYVNKIASVVKEAIKLDPDHKTEVWLVGTAALRKADDGSHLVEALSHKINDELQVDANFKIISQKDEGIYAFEGGVGALKLDANKVVSWDIGGGSMQLTGKQDEDYQVLGGTVASSTFKTMVMDLLVKEQIVKDVTDSIYPINSSSINKIIELGVSKLNFPADKEEWFAKKRTEEGVEIVGVGNIHAALLGSMKDHLGHTMDSYTKEDVAKLLEVFSNKSVDQVKGLIPKGSHPFLENYVVNIMLVAATMEKYHIDTVRVADVSNVNTLLYKASINSK